MRQTLDRANPGSIIVLHLHGGLAALTDEALPPPILSDVLVG